MHRASSTTRVSDEFFSAGTNSAAVAAAAMSSPNPKPTVASPATANSDLDHLPTYNPLSHVAKKEKNRFRSAENVIHLIPLMLVLCAIILWLFSGPGKETKHTKRPFDRVCLYSKILSILSIPFFLLSS